MFVDDRFCIKKFRDFIFTDMTTKTTDVIKFSANISEVLNIRTKIRKISLSFNFWPAVPAEFLFPPKRSNKGGGPNRAAGKYKLAGALGTSGN